MTVSKVQKSLAALALVAAAGLTLSACAAPEPEPTKTSTPTESPIGGDVVAPVELNYQDINGQTIELKVGQVININYGGVNDGEITVEIADPNVVEYGAAEMKDGVQYSAHLTALSGGESKVAFKFNGGDTKELTVQVLLG